MTPLLENGKPRRVRAAPVYAHLRSHRDKAGRLIYQLYYLDKGGTQEIFGEHLISPQPGDILEHAAVYHGYYLSADTGQLYAQAWEVEAARRR